MLTLETPGTNVLYGSAATARSLISSAEVSGYDDTSSSAFADAYAPILAVFHSYCPAQTAW